MLEKTKIEIMLATESRQEVEKIAEYLESLKPEQVKEFSIFAEGASFAKLIEATS